MQCAHIQWLARQCAHLQWLARNCVFPSLGIVVEPSLGTTTLPSAGGVGYQYCRALVAPWSPHPDSTARRHAVTKHTSPFWCASAVGGEDALKCLACRLVPIYIFKTTTCAKILITKQQQRVRCRLECNGHARSNSILKKTSGGTWASLSKKLLPGAVHLIPWHGMR